MCGGCQAFWEKSWGKPLSARGARKFGRGGCATWGKCCVWMANSLSLSRDCVGGGQHAADTAAAREPGMEEIHVVGKIFWPQYFVVLRFCSRSHRPRLRRSAPASPLRRRGFAARQLPRRGSYKCIVAGLVNGLRPKGSPSPLVVLAPAPQRGSAPRSEHLRCRASYVWQMGMRNVGKLLRMDGQLPQP